MSKFSDSFRAHKLHYILTGVISFLVGVGIFCLCFFLRGIEIVSAVNAVSYAAIALVASAVLYWVYEQGAFDIFAYGVKQVFSSAFSKNPNKYNDYPAYKADKAAIRAKSAHGYVSILFASIPFVVAIIVLEIIYHLGIN